jgi:membrane protein required for colicin V production
MDVPANMGIIIDVIVALVLIFSFLGGLKEGAVKEFIGLLAFVIALVLAGPFTGLISGWFSFIANDTWRAFLTFLLALGIIIILLHLIFWFPKTLLDKIWSGGFLWSLLGGVFGLADAVIGLILMMVLLDTYPVFPWLNDILISSNIMNWLVSSFGGVVSTLLKAAPQALKAGVNTFSCVA